MERKNDTEGLKYDSNKLRWDLLPLELIEEIVRVYTAGAVKYGDNNWKELENGYNRYKAAMFRHLMAYEKGVVFDDDTGCRHLAQVAWNAIAMLYFSKQPLEPTKQVDAFTSLYDTTEPPIEEPKDFDNVNVPDCVVRDYADPVDAFAPSGEKETIEAAKRVMKVLEDDRKNLCHPDITSDYNKIAVIRKDDRKEQ